MTATVHDVFAAAAAKWPRRPFMEVLPRTAEVYGIPAEEITFAQALAGVDAWADRLREAGYAPGMRLSLLHQCQPPRLQQHPQRQPRPRRQPLLRRQQMRLPVRWSARSTCRLNLARKCL